MPDGLPHRSCRVFRAYRIPSVSAVRRCCFFLRQKRAFLPYQYRRRKYESDKISEKALLYRRQIACQPYESTHKSKAKGGADNAQHAFVLRGYFTENFRHTQPPVFASSNGSSTVSGSVISPPDEKSSGRSNL